MRSVLLVQHSPTDGPGAIAAALSARGVPFRVARVDEGERPALGDARALVVLGGAPCANDDPVHPFLSVSRALLGEALDRIPVLGVCLGAQLLAQAAGGAVVRGGARELGWHEVEKTSDARSDSLFDALPGRFTPFSWHDDAIELPARAVRLARSAVAPVPAFRLGERAYGVQFHLELDASTVAEWTSHAPRPLHGDTRAHIEEQERLAKALFGRWAGSLLP
jgi:GMP synthase-like glutamine amidotransferase